MKKIERISLWRLRTSRLDTHGLHNMLFYGRKHEEGRDSWPLAEKYLPFDPHSHNRFGLYAATWN
jgi:hypothetical protein